MAQQSVETITLFRRLEHERFEGLVQPDRGDCIRAIGHGVRAAGVVERPGGLIAEEFVDDVIREAVAWLMHQDQRDERLIRYIQSSAREGTRPDPDVLLEVSVRLQSLMTDRRVLRARLSDVSGAVEHLTAQMTALGERAAR